MNDSYKIMQINTAESNFIMSLFRRKIFGIYYITMINHVALMFQDCTFCVCVTCD